MRYACLLGLAGLLPGQGYFVALPDTQHYAYDEGRMDFMRLAILGIRTLPPPIYVTHEGDLTEYASPAEFQRTLAAMHWLDPIPWGISIGNHDYDGGAKCTRQGEPYPCTAMWRQYVGPENHIREAGGIGWLHLEYLPSDAALGWAMDWMDTHPTTPVVLTTHYWLDPEGGLGRTGSDLDGATDNSAREAWAKLRRYPQIWLVCCGHRQGEGLERERTELGTLVVHVLANYQDDPYGGNGFVRLYGWWGGQLHGLTHSWGWSGLPPNRFGYWSTPSEDPAALAQRLATMRVQHVEPVADTFVAPCWGGIGPRGTWEWLWCAGSGCQERGLLRFEVSARPAGAILSLTVEGPDAEGDGFELHRCLVPWTESSTWGEVGGVPYDPAVIAATPSPLGRGTITLDVTGQAQRWASGQEPNYGFVLIGLGNSCAVRTRDWWARSERPVLTVWY